MSDEHELHGATAVEEEEARQREAQEQPEAEPEAEPEIEAAPAPTAEEKFLAALSHFCIVALFPVIIAPLMIWMTERNRAGRSAYVMHHAQQAVLYQVLLVGAIIVLSATVFLSPVALLLALAGVIYGVVGGILACTGRKFNYLWVGEYVKRWTS